MALSSSLPSNYSKMRLSAYIYFIIKIRTFKQEIEKEARALLLLILRRDPYTKGKNIFIERNRYSIGF